MIPLFNINNYEIDTASLGNHLHGPIVDEFVEEFCSYIGATYGCALNSATNAIFLAFERESPQEVTIPSVLPPVVYNALHHAGSTIKFKDDTAWVGGSYVLHDFGDYKVIDSAQKVESGQFKREAADDDLMIFSFYPTKPVGGMDGGIIVSNNKEKIDYFKQRSLNGMSFAENNWERKQISMGWKMYMNSCQAFFALQNLKLVSKKNSHIEKVRRSYNEAFGLKNTSNHLYRINVRNRSEVIDKLSKKKITTGIHYTPLHMHHPYSQEVDLPSSEKDGATTLSIPFNEKLSIEIPYIVEEIKNVARF